MRRKIILVAIVLLAFTASYLAKKAMQGSRGRVSDFNLITYPKDPNSEEYRLIVSLAPSITEILFALGLEDRIAGVTRYCDFPPAARTKRVLVATMTPTMNL
jgi:ABC-type hemin transport system substrate-binding protein